MMNRQQLDPIRADGAATLSLLGNVFGFLTVPWIFIGLGISGAIPSRGLADQALVVRVAYTVLTLLLAFGPMVFFVLVGSFAGRTLAVHPSIRWMFTDPIPGATFDAAGMTLCLPSDSCHRFEWDEVAGMEPSIAWLRKPSGGLWPPLDLTARDGTVLLGVPASVYRELEAAGSRWWARTNWSWSGHPRTLAEYVVQMRPDRYVLIDTQYDGRHHWFELASAAGDRALALELGQLAASSGA